MEPNTRSRILLGIGTLCIVGVGVWWYFGFSLEFMKFFAAEPGAVSRAPTDITCGTLSATVNPGQALTVVAYGARDDVYHWSAPGGVITAQAGSSLTVRYDTPGLKKILIFGVPLSSGDDSIENFAVCEVTVRGAAN